jgi:hypothetical protein
MTWSQGECLNACRNMGFLHHSRSVVTKWSLRQKIDTVKKLFLALSSFLAVVASTAFAEGGEFHLMSSEWHDGRSVPEENVFNGSGCSGANT